MCGDRERERERKRGSIAQKILKLGESGWQWKKERELVLCVVHVLWRPYWHCPVLVGINNGETTFMGLLFLMNWEGGGGWGGGVGC